MKDCIFCKIYKSGRDIIYENDHFFSRFDQYPVTPGHSEVIPKRHVASLLDLSKEEWSSLKPAIKSTMQKIESIELKKVYQGFIDEPLNQKSINFCEEALKHIGINKKPDAYNIGINEGKAAGRTIDHLHIHIIPRFFGDVENYIGGVRHIIPGKGNYK